MPFLDGSTKEDDVGDLPRRPQSYPGRNISVSSISALFCSELLLGGYVSNGVEREDENRGSVAVVASRN